MALSMNMGELKLALNCASATPIKTIVDAGFKIAFLSHRVSGSVKQHEPHRQLRLRVGLQVVKEKLKIAGGNENAVNWKQAPSQQIKKRNTTAAPDALSTSRL